MVKAIHVQLKDLLESTTLSMDEFERVFNVTYHSTLTIPSEEQREILKKNCPYLLRLEQLLFSNDEDERRNQTYLSEGYVADTTIKWISHAMGYGLFANTDLPENAFIGEYAGVVRELDKKHPDLNGYCFHYPTRFWSYRYFVIDALHEGNTLRFINHSNKPNLQPLWLLQDGILRLVFVAKTFISKDSELTFDYGQDYWLRRKQLQN